MKLQHHPLWTDYFLRISFLVAMLATVGQVAVFTLGITPRSEPIFLSYTTYLGVDRIGVWYLVYFIPLASLILTGLDITIAAIVIRKEPVLARMVMIAAALIAILLVFQSILIVRLNA